MMESQTHTPVKYEDLTPDQKKEICNGCGGKGGWIKPPHRVLFKESCQPHDYNYFVGCSWWDKIKADWKLRRSMRAKVKTTKIRDLRNHLYFEDKFLPDWAIRQIYYRWADAYFAGVLAAGAVYFYFGDKKRYPKTEEMKKLVMISDVPINRC